jgi:hypothetical protein
VAAFVAGAPARIRGGKASDTDPEQMFGDLIKEVAPSGSMV